MGQFDRPDHIRTISYWSSDLAVPVLRRLRDNSSCL